MKKIVTPFLLVFFAFFGASAAFAQINGGELTIKAEARSGILWTKEEKVGKAAKENVSLGSKDDAGENEGRFRLSLDYAVENMGVKVRFQWDNWNNTPNKPVWWDYAFAYGNFFEDQLTVSVGKLGSSPWGTGGPEMWKELEVTNYGGMRVEYKPLWVPGELNIGVVLNWVDGSMDQGLGDVEPTLAHLLRESVLGVSYTHEYFHVRFAYRLDSELDVRPGSNSGGGVNEGDDLIYRVEERILRNYVPGLSVWALGYFTGVGAENESYHNAKNWLFAEYDPGMFTAQMRFGLDVFKNRSVLHLRPNFYWHFFDRLLSVGMAFLYGQDFGEGKLYPGAPYTYIELEPKLQLNFSPNAYIAFAYNWRREYINKQHEQPGQAPIDQYQWMNLMFGLTL